MVEGLVLAERRQKILQLNGKKVIAGLLSALSALCVGELGVQFF